jgi:hypothetical protein
LIGPREEARLARARHKMGELRAAGLGRLEGDEWDQLEELLAGDWDGRGVDADTLRRLLAAAEQCQAPSRPSRRPASILQRELPWLLPTGTHAAGER